MRPGPFSSSSGEPREHRFECVQEPNGRRIVLQLLEQRGDPRDDGLAALALVRDGSCAASGLQEVETDRRLVREEDQQIDVADRAGPIARPVEYLQTRRASPRR